MADTIRTTETESDARQQALAQVASIVEMVAALECDYGRLQELRDERDNYCDDDQTSPTERGDRVAWARDNPGDAEELADLEEAAGDCEDRDDAEQRIQEDPLSVEVRSGWTVPGQSGMQAEEFRIVLCTGGPHVELVGDLDESGEPDRVRVLYRDWGGSGELFDFDRDAVQMYCHQFCFEGGA